MSTKISTENKLKLMEKLKGNDIPFVYLPSAYLKELIIKNPEHHILKKLPKVYISAFLEGNGVRLDSTIIKRLINGTLDKYNLFMIDNGTITIESDYTFKVKGLNNDN